MSQVSSIIFSLFSARVGTGSHCPHFTVGYVSCAFFSRFSVEQLLLLYAVLWVNTSTVSNSHLQAGQLFIICPSISPQVENMCTLFDEPGTMYNRETGEFR